MSARVDDPDFVPSLRILIEREGFPDTDIAVMFGVSFQRVAQWRYRYRINRPCDTRCVRRWDDNANRFEPVAVWIVRAYERSRERNKRLQRKRDRLAVRQAKFRAAIAGLRTSLGRNPTKREIACAITGRDVPQNSVRGILTSAWDASSRPYRDKYREAMAAIQSELKDHDDY